MATKKSQIEMRSRAKHKAKGLCLYCNEKAVNKNWCEKHREYYRKRCRNYYRKKHNIPLNKSVKRTKIQSIQ